MTGFPPGTLIGTLHLADAAAAQAQVDQLAAYNDAASRPPDATIPTELGGTTVRSPSGIVPTGPVEFFSDGMSLGTAQFDGTGHAELTVAPLSEGVHEIVAVFPGTTELDGSTSPVFVQAVASQGFCLIGTCGPTCGAVSQARVPSTAAERMTCPSRRSPVKVTVADAPVGISRLHPQSAPSAFTVNSTTRRSKVAT
ncbi:hypothetical protein GCM10018952_41440 [Streptosporangium vulgare]